MNTFYLPASGQVLLASQLEINTGFAPTADPAVLAANGIYTVIPAADPYDPYLYVSEAVYTVAGNYVQQSWVATPLPLSTAKQTGSSEAKTFAKQEVENINAAYGLNAFSFAGIASQTTPPARYQEVLDAVTAVTDQLDTDLTIIDTATSVDEINAVVHKPYGTIMTGRGGPGQSGPLDLNLTYFTAINDLGFGQDALELYVPGTDTAIPYTDALPEPFHFDSQGDCFNSGDYRLVIRMADSGAVISTITVPQGANTEVDWTYNPVIPALSGGSSSSSRK
jgi:hypothetical protein